MRMMATGAEEEVVEVGYFGAGQFITCDELSAGMVGYITASIKMSAIPVWAIRLQMPSVPVKAPFRAIKGNAYGLLRTLSCRRCQIQ